MQHKHKLAFALGFLGLLGAVEVAQARIVIFGGTRSQVVGACGGPARQFSSGLDGNGIGWARCVDTVRNTSVICDDTGRCVGSYYSATFTPKPQPKPRGNFVPPESLSEQSSSGEVPIEAPPVNPDTDVVIFN